MGLLNKVWSMLWNAPPERKAASIAALIPAGSADWTLWTFQSYASEAYGGNPYVYRAVKLTADALSAIEVYAVGQARDEDGTPKTDPIDDQHDMMTVLEQPNGYQSWELFAQEFVAHIFLAGEAFILRPETKVERLTLTLLRPDMVQIIPTRDQQGNEIKHMPAGYTYGFGAGAVTYPPERVMHVYLYNPLNDSRGMSPLSPAARSIDLNNSGRIYHKALFDNGAVGGVTSTSTESASEAELEVLREQIRLKKAGAIKAGETWLLPSTQKMEKAAWSPRDALTPEITVMSLREIAVALGIDPALLGDSTSKIYANVREARSALYVDVAIPLAKMLFGALSAFLSRDWYHGVKYVLDFDSIPELQESQDGLWNRAVQGKQSGIITPNEARELLGYERVSGPEGEPTWADEFYAADGITPLSDAGLMAGIELLPADAEPVDEAVAQPLLPAGAPVAEPASNTALNGAQITSALDVVARVAARELPRPSGIAMLVSFFNLTQEQAEAIMGEVGTSFFVAEPEQETVDVEALSEVESRLEEGDVEGALHAAQKAGLPRREKELAKARRKGLPILKRIVRQLVEHDIAEAMEKV